mmetsp:Transcript_56336/g.142495  ORF Transcript_56336/g.142495 Transcript_56336/m.142495 type:complete len:236 (-) Transcript_56336:448-1155(-)
MRPPVEEWHWRSDAAQAQGQGVHLASAPRVHEHPNEHRQNCRDEEGEHLRERDRVRGELLRLLDELDPIDRRHIPEGSNPRRAQRPHEQCELVVGQQLLHGAHLCCLAPCGGSLLHLSIRTVCLLRRGLLHETLEVLRLFQVLAEENEEAARCERGEVWQPPSPCQHVRLAEAAFDDEDDDGGDGPRAEGAAHRDPRKIEAQRLAGGNLADVHCRSRQLATSAQALQGPQYQKRH